MSEINGEHEVKEIPDANQMIIEVATSATSTTQNLDPADQGGTSIEIKFIIEPGNADTTLGYGWGTGVWGGDESSPIPDREWGLGHSPVDLPQRDWFR